MPDKSLNFRAKKILLNKPRNFQKNRRQSKEFTRAGFVKNFPNRIKLFSFHFKSEIEMTITPEIIEQHGLSADEYAKILEILGREPNLTELGVFFGDVVGTLLV